VIENLEALAEAQQKKKAGPLALDPVMAKTTPLQATKGKWKKKSRPAVSTGNDVAPHSEPSLQAGQLEWLSTAALNGPERQST